MLHPYAREQNARVRARTLGVGATVTRSRHDGWYAVGPVEVDSAGRRDRRLYGINRPTWTITRELDEIRARGADAPAEWSAYERELLELLDARTPAQIERDERAAQAARRREIAAQDEADERAEAIAMARAENARSLRIEARRSEIDETRALARSMDARHGGRKYSEIAALYVRLCELEERDNDAAEWRATLARVLREEAEQAEEDTHRREHLARKIGELRVGALIRLPGHDRAVFVTDFDPDALTVTVQRARGLVTYDAVTGCVVTANTQTKAE